MSDAAPRTAVGFLLFDSDNKIALSHIGVWNVTMLPGGGVNEGESLHDAVKREAWEETGCRCEVTGEIGLVCENRAEHDFVQKKYHYFARVVGEKGELHFEDYEIESETTVRWHPIERAVEMLTEFKAENVQQKFCKRRDLAVLNEAIMLLRDGGAFNN